MLMNAWPLIASTTTKSYSSHSTTSIRAQNSESESTSVLESLKEDIASNPNDFITFETQIAADRFIAKHEDEAYRETKPKVIRRGIIGYWRGKILVVLPSLFNAKPL
jgi:hypothetical protein